MGSPFTADLPHAAGAAIGRPGIAQDLIGHWPGRTAALAARLASALHAAVLTGRDEELAACYPSPEFTGDGRKAWAHEPRLSAASRDGYADQPNIACCPRTPIPAYSGFAGSGGVTAGRG